MILLNLLLPNRSPTHFPILLFYHCHCQHPCFVATNCQSSVWLKAVSEDCLWTDIRLLIQEPTKLGWFCGEIIWELVWQFTCVSQSSAFQGFGGRRVWYNEHWYETGLGWPKVHIFKIIRENKRLILINI